MSEGVAKCLRSVIIKGMTRIAFYGASPEDQAFFTQILKGHTLVFAQAPLDAATLDPQTEILSVFVNNVVTEGVLTALPNLKLLACRSTGVNNVDMAAAKKHGVMVANVPSYGGTTVAEYAFTLLLMLTRHMPDVLNESVSNAPSRERERGSDLFGKTMGVIGTGSIGRGVARIAKGFGMNVLGYDKYPNTEEAQKIGFTYVNDIDDLLAKSDVITLHIPYTHENHHFLSKQRLAKLKKGAIVLNTARGELVDTVALVDALNSKQVGAAALDVMENEYLMNPDELLDLATQDDTAKQMLRHAVALAALQRCPNAILTNHNAYNTTEALQRINQTTADNINGFLDGGKVFTV
jgi:D-lactate dehydrogenase